MPAVHAERMHSPMSNSVNLSIFFGVQITMCCENALQFCFCIIYTINAGISRVSEHISGSEEYDLRRESPVTCIIAHDVAAF